MFCGKKLWRVFAHKNTSFIAIILWLTLILSTEIVMVILRTCVVTCNHYTVDVKKIETGFESIYKSNKNVHITFFSLKRCQKLFHYSMVITLLIQRKNW